MKSSVVEKYHRLSIRKKVATRGLIVLGIMVLLIGSLTYYGSQVGSFVIKVQQRYEKGLSLCSDEDGLEYSSRLIAQPLKDCIDSCYQEIPENIEEGIGSKNDSKGRYLAYSFYLVNTGTMSTNYTLDFKITQATKNIDSILRVLVIQDGVKSYYSKAGADDPTSEKGEPSLGILPDGDVGIIQENTAFIGNTVTFQTFYDFEVNEKSKFTFVLWLDGYDVENPNGNTSMLGAALKTDITFSAIG